MTAFVILAAGRGVRVSRVGGDLHKALLPLDGKAVLSHLFELAPPNARVIVCVGSRAQQVVDYCALAHPAKDVTFVNVRDWDQPGAGPGRSLLTARDAVGDDDVVFTSCDTLWHRDSRLWDGNQSWAAYAPMPVGTEPHRWCRLDVAATGDVTEVLDKTRNYPSVQHVYVGMARIARDDIRQFWLGVQTGKHVDGEMQVTGGLATLIGRGLGSRCVDWIDTGDETAYRRAVAQRSGYDWTKTGQATYVLPREMRVVKYMSDAHAIETRRRRGDMLLPAVPAHIESRDNMLAYEYVEGSTVYSRLDVEPWTPLNDTLIRKLMNWRERRLTTRVEVTDSLVADAVRRFYQLKTNQRIVRLRTSTQHLQAADAVKRIDFDSLIAGFQPGIPHGDLNFGNVVVDVDDEFTGIDWREDFAGQPWFDLRYDVAKLLAGTVVHWDRARRGDFTPWDAGPRYADVIREFIPRTDALHDVELIAALSLLNCAPLHAAPLDEILVARGCAWLERLT